MIGPKVILEGPSGTGKTYALGTLVDWAQAHNYSVFVLFVENGLETLLGYWTDRGLSVPSCLHWHEQMTRPIALAGLQTAARDVGRLTYESLTKLQDPDRAKNNAHEALLASCADFPCDRTGEKFGAVDTWPPERIFVIDSLSELANAVAKMCIGNKPMMSQPEYQVAQTNLMNFLRLCTQGMPCPFILTAHIDRITNEITGTEKLMTKAIGRAIAGDIPALFSDTILTVREGTSFYWDTANLMADLKTRNLPIAAKQPPNFAAIMDKWLARMEATK